MVDEIDMCLRSEHGKHLSSCKCRILSKNVHVYVSPLPQIYYEFVSLLIINARQLGEIDLTTCLSDSSILRKFNELEDYRIVGTG